MFCKIVPDVFSRYFPSSSFSFFYLLKVSFMSISLEISFVKFLHAFPASLVSYSKVLPSPIKFLILFVLFTMITFLHELLRKPYSSYTKTGTFKI